MYSLIDVNTHTHTHTHTHSEEFGGRRGGRGGYGGGKSRVTFLFSSLPLSLPPPQHTQHAPPPIHPPHQKNPHTPTPTPTPTPTQATVAVVGLAAALVGRWLVLEAATDSLTPAGPLLGVMLVCVCVCM